LGFAGAGAVIFANTNVFNEYVPGDEHERLRALYEQRYKEHEELSQPRLTDVNLHVDIFPEERRVRLKGSYELVNKSGETIETLHLNLDKRLDVLDLSLKDDALETNDTDVGYRIYRLCDPLAPGEGLALDFDLAINVEGFVNNGPNHEIVANGTFFDNSTYLPRVGYLRERELKDPRIRRKQGLDAARRLADPSDSTACRVAFFPDGDWISFEATVSTSPDQIALAPGYLQREWEEGGRRYFHYKMDRPIDYFFAFVSGRYAVLRDSWNDVSIEVYHHPQHNYNIGRMIGDCKVFCVTGYTVDSIGGANGWPRRNTTSWMRSSTS